MRGYNKCVWGGNLTADPQLRTTGAGAPLLIFRIAVTRTYSSNDLTQDDTRYFRAIL
jgi:single-stranded DNA-binding protein